MVSTKRIGTSIASPPMSTAVHSSPMPNSVSVSKSGFSPTKSISKVEPRYFESEKVLCYEPDPTKVQVIYDAKILKVEKEEESKGRVCAYQYLVHFQGWAATWDRFVPDEFLLKDTPENRDLQMNLFRGAEEARQMSSKKKKKKKRKRSSVSPEEMTNDNDPVVIKVEGELERQGEEQQQEQHQLLSEPRDNDQADFRSSPKKKKKKKKEKRIRILIPQIIESKTPKPEQQIGKIVILNGTKITSPPISPLNVVAVKSVTPSASSSTKTASPLLPLRSASPKFCPEIAVAENSVMALPAPELSTDSGIEVIKRRKRKLSADSAAKKTFLSGKRQRIVSGLKEINATPVPTSSVPTPPSKICSAPKLKEERIIKNGVVVATNPAAATNGRKRESLNGYPSITLSNNLKRHLTSDFEMVTKKRRLNILPAEPSIVNVLEDFVRHYAAGRLVAFEKHQRKSLYTAHRRENGEMTYQRALEAIQMCKEVAEGLRVLIDFNLQRSLLYRNAGELEQFEEVMRSGIPTRVAPTKLQEPSPGQDLEVAVFNGSSPTLSSVDSAASIPCSKNSARAAPRKLDPTSNNDANPEPTLKRRHTATPTQTSLSRRTSCDTTNFHLFSTRSSTASNKDGGGSSCSTNSRSTATNRTSLLMPPAASSPSTPAANKAMRSVESWKLVPPELYLQTPPMPSLIYGPIHLLRLFVKLPEILGRMNLPPKTCKLIVKYMDAVIEYFEGHPDLFSSEMYEC